MDGKTPMKLYKITLDDGTSYTTHANGTLEEVTKYFLNAVLQFGDTEEKPYDHLKTVVKVEVV